jgi:hypothetical protein
LRDELVAQKKKDEEVGLDWNARGKARCGWLATIYNSSKHVARVA